MPTTLSFANFFSPFALSKLTNSPLTFAFALSLLIMMFPSTVYAMHIAEGILPLHWAIIWYAALGPFLFYGIKQIQQKSAQNLSFKPLVGLLSAVVFVISCMPVPVPVVGSCSHPTGVAISAIMLGPFISTVITTVALLLQALLLAHGGLSTLGANAVSMGVIGSLSAIVLYRILSKYSNGVVVPAFVAGVVADWATYFMTSLQLALSLAGAEANFVKLLGQIVIAFIPTQLPLGILEGAITAGVVKLLYAKRPDLLVSLRVVKPKEAVV